VKELLIEKAKTCAVTGHRDLLKDLNIDLLRREFIKAINIGYNTFLVGMALGFDTICFQTLESLRKEYNIKIIACVPCPSQSYKFTIEQKIEYDRMIESSDDALLISEEYNKYCMKKRNDFMVNNCSLLICYLRRDFGGTFYTVNKAKKDGIKIIEI
jgi:uncharacterized phage-like protein YoqJ